MLEARVAKLEAAIEHMQRDLTGLQVDVKTLLGHVSDVRANTATLVERSSHLATREWVWNRGVALFVFLFLTLGALVTYAPRLQAALGVLSSSGTSTGSAGPASR